MSPETYNTQTRTRCSSGERAAQTDSGQIRTGSVRSGQSLSGSLTKRSSSAGQGRRGSQCYGGFDSDGSDTSCEDDKVSEGEGRVSRHPHIKHGLEYDLNTKTSSHNNHVPQRSKGKFVKSDGNETVRRNNQLHRVERRERETGYGNQLNGGRMSREGSEMDVTVTSSSRQRRRRVNDRQVKRTQLDGDTDSDSDMSVHSSDTDDSVRGVNKLVGEVMSPSTSCSSRHRAGSSKPCASVGRPSPTSSRSQAVSNRLQVPDIRAALPDTPSLMEVRAVQKMARLMSKQYMLAHHSATEDNRQSPSQATDTPAGWSNPTSPGQSNPKPPGRSNPISPGWSNQKSSGHSNPTSPHQSNPTSPKVQKIFPDVKYYQKSTYVTDGGRHVSSTRPRKDPDTSPGHSSWPARMYVKSSPRSVASTSPGSGGPVKRDDRLSQENMKKPKSCESLVAEPRDVKMRTQLVVDRKLTGESWRQCRGDTGDRMTPGSCRRSLLESMTRPHCKPSRRQSTLKGMTGRGDNSLEAKHLSDTVGGGSYRGERSGRRVDIGQQNSPTQKTGHYTGHYRQRESSERPGKASKTHGTPLPCHPVGGVHEKPVAMDPDPVQDHARVYTAPDPVLDPSLDVIRDHPLGRRMHRKPSSDATEVEDHRKDRAKDHITARQRHHSGVVTTPSGTSPACVDDPSNGSDSDPGMEVRVDQGDSGSKKIRDDRGVRDGSQGDGGVMEVRYDTQGNSGVRKVRDGSGDTAVRKVRVDSQGDNGVRKVRVDSQGDNGVRKVRVDSQGDNGVRKVRVDSQGDRDDNRSLETSSWETLTKDHISRPKQSLKRRFPQDTLTMSPKQKRRSVACGRRDLLSSSVKGAEETEVLRKQVTTQSKLNTQGTGEILDKKGPKKQRKWRFCGSKESRPGTEVDTAHTTQLSAGESRQDVKGYNSYSSEQEGQGYNRNVRDDSQSDSEVRDDTQSDSEVRDDSQSRETLTEGHSSKPKRGVKKRVPQDMLTVSPKKRKRRSVDGDRRDLLSPSVKCAEERESMLESLDGMSWPMKHSPQATGKVLYKRGPKKQRKCTVYGSNESQQPTEVNTTHTTKLKLGEGHQKVKVHSSQSAQQKHLAAECHQNTPVDGVSSRRHKLNTSESVLKKKHQHMSVDTGHLTRHKHVSEEPTDEETEVDSDGSSESANEGTIEASPRLQAPPGVGSANSDSLNETFVVASTSQSCQQTIGHGPVITTKVDHSGQTQQKGLLTSRDRHGKVFQVGRSKKVSRTARLQVGH